jgi:hypothetical protein
MKTMTIYLSNDNNIVDWLRTMTTSKLNKRYNMKHLSEDMKVNYSMLYRFMKGKPVGQDFFIAWFNYFVI